MSHPSERLNVNSDVIFEKIQAIFAHEARREKIAIVHI
jgi:hypothetical protein